MTSKLVGVAVSSLLTLAGCGASASPVTNASPVLASSATAGSMTTMPVTTEAPIATIATPMVELTALPNAPWAAPPIPSNEAPRQILSAWENADNRESCAPIATRSLGRATGARGRTSPIAGGWLVEFDRPGLPGIDRQGRECDTCGRSVFGIAGTAIEPEALDPDNAALTPTYSDGSHARVEVTDTDGESVASVTFTVNGQSCVYEVWSLLGADHLNELVSGLRFVEQPPTTGSALARR